MQPEVLAICSLLRGKTVESLDSKFELPSALVESRLAEVLDRCWASTESHDRYGRSEMYHRLCCKSPLSLEEEHWLAHPSTSELLQRMSEKPFRIGGVYGSELWRLDPHTVVANQSLWRPWVLRGSRELVESRVPLQS